MGAATKQLANKKVLKNLIPLNALTSANLEKIARKARIDEVQAGRYVFKQGDRDNHTVYLLEGTVTLYSESREVDEINAESSAAQHPLAHFQPRQVSARAKQNVLVARIDTNLLDVMLTWEQSSGYEVNELEAQDDTDWMTKMLQSQALQKLPPSNIQKLLMRMQEVEAPKGQIIIHEGDIGNDYYIIKKGHCQVTRKSPQGQTTQLAELKDGDSFGEDALLSNDKRNATVTMTGDGTLMRLTKQDFLELLKQPLVNQINYQQAALITVHGATWLDVRLPDEFKHNNISGSINIPLATLRKQLHVLDKSKQYIVYCDTGRRSASAAFLLSQKGIDVQVLNGGISSVPESDLGDDNSKTTAEIINFNDNRRKPISAESDQTDEIIRLKEEIKQLSQTLQPGSDANGQLRQLTEENQKIKRELEAMEKEADTSQSMFEKRFSNMQQQIKEKDQNLADLRTRLSSVETAGTQDQTNFHKQLQAGAKEAEQLRHRLAVMEKENQNAQDMIQTLTKQSSTTKLQNREHEKEISRLQQALESHHNATQQSGEIKALLEKERAAKHQLSEQLASANEKAKQLQKEVIELREAGEQVQEMQARLTETQTQLEAANDDAEAGAKLKAQLAVVEKELAKKTSTLAQSKLDSDKQHLLLESLHQSLAQSQQEKDKFQEQISKMESQHLEETNALGAKLAEMREKFHHTQLSKQDIKEREGQLSMQVKILESEITESQATIQNYKHEFEQVNNELHISKEKLRAQDAATQKARMELEILQSESSQADQEVERVKTELQETHEKMLQTLREKAEIEVAKDSAENKLSQIAEQHEQAMQAARDETVRSEYEAARMRAELELATKKLARAQSPDAENAQNNDQSVARLNEEIVCLQAELAAAKEHTQEQQKRFNEQLLAREEQARQAMQQHLDESRKRQDEESQVYNDHVKKEIESSKEELLQSKMQLRQWQIKCSTAQAAAKSAKEEIDDLKGELEVRKNLSGNSKKAQPDAQWQDDQDPNDLDCLFNNDNVPQINTQVVSANRDDNDDDWARLDESLDIDEPAPPPPAASNRPARSLEPAPRPSSGSSQPATFGQSGQATLKTQATGGGSQSSTLSGKQAVAKRRKKKLLVKLLTRSLILVVLGAAAAGTYRVLGKQKMMAYYHQFISKPQSKPANHSPPVAAKPKSPSTEKPTHHKPKAPKKPIRRPQPSKPSKRKASPAASVSSPHNQAGLKGTIVGKQTLTASNTAFKPGMVVIAQQPRLVYQDLMRNGSKGPILVEMPGGEYVIGNPDLKAPADERPAHQVQVKAFSMTQNEITFAQYDTFTKATKRMRAKDHGWGRDNRPVIRVNWYDAKAYAQWLSSQTQQTYRLPTEAEWELAAAATQGNKTHYWWGMDIGSGNANCINCGSPFDGKQTAPVGSFKENAFGLHDTAGNVMEWVEDCYHANYFGAPINAKAWAGGDCSINVVRGGAFKSTADSLRTVKRSYFSPSSKQDSVGFRLLREH